jgi:hypothetical protein
MLVLNEDISLESLSVDLSICLFVYKSLSLSTAGWGLGAGAASKYRSPQHGFRSRQTLLPRLKPEKVLLGCNAGLKHLRHLTTERTPNAIWLNAEIR